MIVLPESTKVNKRLPKDSFYKKLELNSAIKDKFVSDVERIVIENTLTKENLNLPDNSGIEEILVLSLTLKKPEIDNRIIEAIARQNSHNLVFLLMFEDQCQLALYYKKLYKTDWLHGDEIKLMTNAFNLEDIWINFIEQIALHEEREISVSRLTIDERLSLQEKIINLEKKIKKLEADINKELQPKKKFDKFTELQKLQKEMELMKHGQA